MIGGVWVFLDWFIGVVEEIGCIVGIFGIDVDFIGDDGLVDYGGCV